MAQYFQSFTGDGDLKIQIDDEFLNLEFKYKTSYTIGASGTITVSYTGQTPCMAVASEYFVTCDIISISGNTTTWRIRNRAEQEDGVSARTINIVCYFFDNTTNAFAAPAVGLQIFNQNSQLVYDSNKRYMVAQHYASNRVSGANITVNLPAGRVFAVAALSSIYSFDRRGFPPGPGPYYQALEITQGSLFRIRSSSFLNRSGLVNQVITPPRGVPYSSDELFYVAAGYGQFLILDVTGY